MSEKSILEQALLQVQNLEEAVKQNAKGILASTMKEELKDLLKESLEEEEETTTEEEVAKPEEEAEQDVTADDEDTDDESEEDVDTDVDADTDLDNLDSTDDDDSDVDTGVDMENMGTDMDTDMESMGNESSMDDEDVMDMTGASDDEVLKVFKAMKPEDGIVVKKDGNNVEFGDGENEYIIKLDSEDSDLDTGMDMGADLDTDVESDVDSDVDMDEMDMDLVDEFIDELNKERKPDWIDVHNLRIIKFGRDVHIDCHLTLPWYYNLEQTHNQVVLFEDVIKRIKDEGLKDEHELQSYFIKRMERHVNTKNKSMIGDCGFLFHR